MDAATEKVIQEEDLSAIIKDLDTIFSQYIRLKYADENGLVACYTSGIKKHYTLMQCSHFIGRSNLHLRWDERNCRVQTQAENEFNHGNLTAYRQKLNEECEGLPDILDEERNIVSKPTKSELKQLIADYAAKVKTLKKKVLNPNQQ